MEITHQNGNSGVAGSSPNTEYTLPCIRPWVQAPSDHMEASSKEETPMRTGTKQA